MMHSTQTFLTTLGLWDGGTPMIDPMQIHALTWVTIIPLAFLISLAYKSVRVGNATPQVIAQQTLKMGLQVLGGMAILGATLHVFLSFIVPLFRG